MPPRTELIFRNTKPKDKPYKLSDGGGLYLHIQPHGSKLWRMAYRYDGRQKVLSFGSYPSVTLANAREAREAAKKLLAQGLDPGLVRKSDRQTKRTARKNTFKSLAEECLEKWKAEGDAEATLTKKKWLLDFAIAGLGNRPIADITASELLAVLRKIEAAGRYDTAGRLRSTVGAVFRYAVATGRAERDISVDLRGALISPTVRHHPAITDPKKIGELLRAIDGFDGHPTTQIALKLAPLLFLRPGELRTAEWSEVDLKTRMIRIPASKMKMRRDHLVPLATQAVKLSEQIQEITAGSKYLFPSIRSWDRPMSENTLNAALRRLGYTSDEMTAHVFRSMASTRLNESGKFGPDVIERQLAHLEQNEVRRAYNSAEHLPERLKMMQYWADYLDNLRMSK
jgi:integrase